jgi:hypothetical protein
MSSLPSVKRVTLYQGEVEHGQSKKWYERTSRKPGFEGQIADIERRQTRISRIKQNLERQLHLVAKLKTDQDPIAKDLDSDYSVGKSQNQPVNIYTFLQDHLNDPAICVCDFQRLLLHPSQNCLVGLSRQAAGPSTSSSPCHAPA